VKSLQGVDGKRNTVHPKVRKTLDFTGLEMRKNHEKKHGNWDEVVHHRAGFSDFETICGGRKKITKISAGGVRRTTATPRHGTRVLGARGSLPASSLAGAG
jgi:hypothetical protein